MKLNLLCKYNLLTISFWSVSVYGSGDFRKTRTARKINISRAKLSLKWLGVIKKVFVQDCICCDNVPPQQVCSEFIDATSNILMLSISIGEWRNISTQKNPKTIAIVVTIIIGNFIIFLVLLKNIPCYFIKTKQITQKVAWITFVKI